MTAAKRSRKDDLALEAAQSEFSSFLGRIKPKDVAPFLQWVQESFSTEKDADEKPKFIRDAYEVINEIRHCLAEKIPTGGQLDSEKIDYPKLGFDSDCNKTNTAHVDCFLFDEDDVQDLVEKGKLTRTYCLDCGSRNTKPLTFISHSLAPAQLEFAFTQLVPLKAQEKNFNLVDIGSRLGAVIYSASLFSAGRTKVTGIELNSDLCKLQEEMIKDFELPNINVVCSDVREQKDVIQTADMIVMNNVFSFFMSVEEQVSCWEFMKSNAKKGCFILHNPNIKDILSHLVDKLSFTVDDWLEEITTEKDCASFAMDNENLFEDCQSLHLYKVK